MPSIFDQIVHHHPDHQENTMTTPQPQIAGTPPQQRSFLSDVAGVLGDLASNSLVDQLAQQSLGKYLQPADTALVLALIRSLEAPHLAAANNVPPRPAQAQQAPPAPANA